MEQVCLAALHSLLPICAPVCVPPVPTLCQQHHTMARRPRRMGCWEMRGGMENKQETEGGRRWRGSGGRGAGWKEELRQEGEKDYKVEKRTKKRRLKMGVTFDVMPWTLKKRIDWMRKVKGQKVRPWGRHLGATWVAENSSITLSWFWKSFSEILSPLLPWWSSVHCCMLLYLYSRTEQHSWQSASLD